MLVERQLEFLRRFFAPRTVFMHLGARDCTLAVRAAEYVERVYALGFPQGAGLRVRLPSNLRLVPSPASVPACSVDVAFGDAAAPEEVHRSLAPGGLYFCAAPPRALRGRLLAAGFGAVKAYAGRLRIACAAARALEPFVELRTCAVK